MGRRDDMQHGDGRDAATLRSITHELRAAAMAMCEDDPPNRAEQIEADLKLVERVKQGEKMAFQEIYQTYAPSLHRRISRMLGGHVAQTEDCLQQVFAQALQSIHSYQGSGVLHAWLNRLTTFVVADEFRNQQSRQGSLKQLWWSWDPRVRQSEAIPERLFTKEEVKALIQEAIAQLSAKKRLALVLCDLEGYSIEEAAAELDAAPGTIASRLHHGRKELRMLVLAASRERGLTVEDWLHG